MEKIKYRPLPGKRSQKGIVLILSLFFLVILTLLGISASGNAGIESIMAASFRDRDRAFAAAESALRDAEVRVAGDYSNPKKPIPNYSFPDLGATDVCTNGLCGPDVTQPIYSIDFYSSTAPGSKSQTFGRWAVDADNKAHVNSSPDISGLQDQPRHMIEALCRAVPGESMTAATCKLAYRITVQAKGNNDSSRVTLQETYVP